MINWTKTKDNKWIIKSNNKTTTVDNIKSLTAWTMAFNKNVTIDEIEIALVEMNRNDHDYCEFGIYGRFTISKRASYDH
jgi:hypothetical protein